MNGWPTQPVIYEVNTAVWLDELSRNAGRRTTLADVSARDWDAITLPGIDAVWLMGVWRRSPAGLALADADPELRRTFRAALPDLRPTDVVGSPYCVREYVVDDAFGGPAELAVARSVLADRGVRLVLDYVPNHVAPDHPWVMDRPDLFVLGEPRDVRAQPRGWLEMSGRILARGRDPYFPPWPDVVQLNAYSPALRAATADTLADIADQCDGIRCDMAMLVTNRVFGTTWGEWVGPAPAEEFWPAVIGRLRDRHPDTVLVAETYWDLERTLQEQGFTFCYDKRLHDHVVEQDPAAMREALRADRAYQSRLVRFLENHDEPRIVGRLPASAERAAAVAIATVPGATLWHEGQFEGRRVRPSVFLSRRPDEPVDSGLVEWHARLLATVAGHRVRRGVWRLLEPVGWPDNQSCRNLLAWCWLSADGAPRHLVVINFSARPAQARIPLDWPDLPGRGWRLADLLGDAVFDRDGDELADSGLYVALVPWQVHLFSVEPTDGVAQP
ncbi:alpha-amylase family glycosyl hydrolase [Kutzneria buriramensis]|uniref:Alpha amylase catalytic subunit n=1 Tax=Kutzneria buriramensis TaxID=1045776 RepID=A0A3E0H0J8_9PSEU|nr:alpha-amylase family glycosyl hydrolase [Kutzneria buriramensis]REH34892.1 alpha amylase catalytic subunit [Kutzneria buriramensis]